MVGEERISEGSWKVIEAEKDLCGCVAWGGGGGSLVWEA